MKDKGTTRHIAATQTWNWKYPYAVGWSDENGNPHFIFYTFAFPCIVSGWNTIAIMTERRDTAHVSIVPSRAVPFGKAVKWSNTTNDEIHSSIIKLLKCKAWRVSVAFVALPFPISLSLSLKSPQAAALERLLKYFKYCKTASVTHPVGEYATTNLPFLVTIELK